MATRLVSKEVDIPLVLLVADSETAEFAAPHIWRAMNEAASLYRLTEIEIPLTGDRDVVVQPRITVAYAGPHDLVDIPSALAPAELQDLVDATIAPTTSVAMADQSRLVFLTREALGIDAPNVVVVHDRLIRPPANIRYIIWDVTSGGVALSFATLDPTYWNSQALNTSEVLRRRTRAALCSIIGSALGFVRCYNPECFLYQDVDRASRLDDLIRIGEEHQVRSLVGRGFADAPNDAALDPVVIADAAAGL